MSRRRRVERRPQRSKSDHPVEPVIIEPRVSRFGGPVLGVVTQDGDIRYTAEGMAALDRRAER